MPGDPACQASVDHIPGHGCFELRVTHETDHRFELLLGKSEEFHQCADMEMVLVERVQEAAFPPVDLLGPLALIRGSENPSTVVLCLDHKNSEAGDNDVIDLSGALRSGMRQVEVMKGMVLILRQPPESASHPMFSQPSLERRRCDYPDQDEEP